MGAAIGLREDFDAAGLKRVGVLVEKCEPSAASVGVGSIYDGQPDCCGADWRVRFADRAGLGGAV